MGNLFSQLETPESRTAFQVAMATALRSMAPPPTYTVSEWADRHRILPKGSSSRPGPWRTESFQREMMDACLEPGVREVVYLTSTQLVKSEALNNIVGYFIDAEPKAIMLVQPTDLAAKNYSKKRIAPMISACPSLYSKVRIATSRAAGNTTSLKEYDGGFLKIAGANSPVSLRSDPIEVLVLDEIDAYPDDPDGEGDPIEIAERRTDNYPFPVIVKASTPSKPKGFSRIDAAYAASDQRRFFVPCPFCSHMQSLEWRDENKAYRLVWERDARGDVLSGSVRYLCSGCGAGIPEHKKFGMLEAGEWRKSKPEVRRIAGFYLNALYSPWKMNWEDLARQWTRAKDPEKLRAFLNTRLAETWDEEAVAGIEPDALRARASVIFGARRPSDENSVYWERIPEGELVLPESACVLVSTADVQDKWIEAQTIGFGPGEECWILDHERIDASPGLDFGDQGNASAWEQLDAFFLRAWLHPGGVTLTPALCLVDSGAHSDSVYDFVLPRQNPVRRVYACKGRDALSVPGIVMEGSTKRGNIRLFEIGTVAAKDRLFARLGVTTPGPGYIHLPAWVSDDYIDQLTSEKKITIRDKRLRRIRREYRKMAGVRNEALDLTVYGFAGLAVLQQIVAPQIYRDLDKVLAVINTKKRPESLLPPRVRGYRSAPLVEPISL